MWVKNCWYVIAWEHEIPATGLFARTVLGEPIVVFRTANGFTALHDRCCHRAAPLSKGRHEGDAVRCGYHGLKFNAQGQCIEVPGMEKVPGHLQVRSYPLVLKNKWLFVWMGDATKADEALLPDNFSNDSADWKNIPGYLHYDTPYLLICDNLMDFSHLSYVHEKTLGGSTAIAQARPTIEAVTATGQRGFTVSRHVPNVPPPAYHRHMRQFAGNVDRWFIYDFLLPGTLLMRSGSRRVGGDPARDLDEAVLLHSCQTLTPETEGTTHYFFQQSHHAACGDAGVTQAIYNNLIVAFNEDRDMISAQAAEVARAPHLPFAPLHFDAALNQFRKLLEAEFAKEHA